MIAVAVWHALDFPDDLDGEFPGVERPTFNRYPPPAYRLAEPGDTIDRVGIYVSSVAAVLALGGLVQGAGRRAAWLGALALAAAGFWTEANPGPSLDGWHGLGWRAIADPSAPAALRLALVVGASVAAAAVLVGVWSLGGLKGSVRSARAAGVAPMFGLAAVFLLGRVAWFPDPEPHGYWPRWASVWALTLYAAALLRLLPERPAPAGRKVARLTAAAACWYALVVAGIDLTWYHRPLERLREIVPGRIYISAMPSGKGLEVAQQRHHFKTIINLFPEFPPLKSPRLPEEMNFVERHGVRYLGSPADADASYDFLEQTLALAQDPNAWPVLVHCHGCMDRTPAWVGIYQFVVAGRPLDESLRFIEQHRGYRPKASVTLLYNRVLPYLAPERAAADPTARLLQACAKGVVDPYLRVQKARARALETSPGAGEAGAPVGVLPSLTPRR